MKVSMVLPDVAAVEFRRSPPCIAAGFSSSVKIDETILTGSADREREEKINDTDTRARARIERTFLAKECLNKFRRAFKLVRMYVFPFPIDGGF